MISGDDDKSLFRNFELIFDADGDGDKHEFAAMSPTLGVVVDTDDPLQMGRLRVFCPALNDNPKKLQHIPWAIYLSPFGGVINNACFTRGSDPANANTTGAVHYGFWGIPEQGAHVAVGCFDGDPRRRFWFGCVPSHQETHTLFNGRYKWSGKNGTPDGPLSSANEPIQPLYSNLSLNFGDRTSPEWRTRGADYQATAVDQNVGELPNSNKSTYLDEQYEQISAAEPDAWVKDALGAHGYDWSGFKGLGAYKSSRVYGWTTPGGHTVMMDDRPFNCRTKIRSVHGHMILLDDTNERIYINTDKGNSYIEMDSNGNIDVYAKRRFSVHSEEDINFSTEGSFRVKATKGIHMYAGDAIGNSGGTPPLDGEVRIESTQDMHLKASGVLRAYSASGLTMETGHNFVINCRDFLVGAQQAVSLQSANINIIAANEIIEQVGSTVLGITPTDIALSASSDVWFKGGAISTSIIYINTTFTLKGDSGGQGVVNVTGPSLSANSLDTGNSGIQFAVWTNRVPQHEPWARTLMQDSSLPQNQANTGYQYNLDWVPQFSSTDKNVGIIEGDETIPRGMFWRR